MPPALTLEAVVNLSAIPSVDHAHHKPPIVYGVDYAIWTNPEPVHALAFLPPQPLYIPAMRQFSNCL